MDKPIILVVDSNKIIIKIIKNALGEVSYHIISAQNGREGLNKLNDFNVDLVIADQALPEMTGMEFLKIAKNEYPDIITVMFVGQVDLKTTIGAINEAGVYKFVLKPWNAFDLRITISRAMELKKINMEKKRLLDEIRKNDALLELLGHNYPELAVVLNEGAKDLEIELIR